MLVRLCVFSRTGFPDDFSSFILQVNLVFLIFSLSVSGQFSAVGSFGERVYLELFGPGDPCSGLVTLPSYQFGIRLGADFCFLAPPFGLLAEWREVRKQLPPVKRVAREDLVGGRLLQARSSHPLRWRN